MELSERENKYVVYGHVLGTWREVATASMRSPLNSWAKELAQFSELSGRSVELPADQRDRAARDKVGADCRAILAAIDAINELQEAVSREG